MGRLISGINGPVQGKIGTVIGSSWRGVPYLKGPYKKRTSKPGEREAGNRNKFAKAHFWLRPLKNFVRAGFKDDAARVQGYLAAKSYLLLHAFEGVQSHMHINPALMKVSMGHLPLPADITVEKMAAGELQFTWAASYVNGAHPKDQAMMLAYDIEHGRAFYNSFGQFRGTGMDTLRTDTAAGNTYHIYLAFTAADRSRQSDSVYLGTITM